MDGVSRTRSAIGDGVEFVLTVDRKVCAFGQVLTQQSVGVFAGTVLSWVLRVAEVHLHAGRGGEFFMPRHFLVLVVGSSAAVAWKALFRLKLLILEHSLTQ